MLNKERPLLREELAMKRLLTVALPLAWLAAAGPVTAGECFWRWMGAGHGPGYHAYNACPTPMPTPVPGWHPVLLPAAEPVVLTANWPGSTAPIDWSRPAAQASLQAWTGP